ncbi:hypothetical protein QTG54_006854 [Skeletonema marinoi]|uniref:Uncharacterized protein n=1 Tax=Skeletonema marinoi TaxID=267567 RepID=A0AAD9DDR1_9STRA|nr:hypothetical protein QTG54_006854 [Skeletonema marinoi]
MQRSTNNRRQKSSNQQDAMMGNRGRLDDQHDLLPLRGPTGGRRRNRNVNQRNNNQPGRRGIIAMELLQNRRARQNMPSWGRRFQPGNGDLNRRGPIPELEPLPRRRNERPLRRQVFPRHHFHGAVVSDGEDDEEEHEYLPSYMGNGNLIDPVSLHSVSDDAVSDDDA